MRRPEFVTRRAEQAHQQFDGMAAALVDVDARMAAGQPADRHRERRHAGGQAGLLIGQVARDVEPSRTADYKLAFDLIVQVDVLGGLQFAGSQAVDTGHGGLFIDGEESFDGAGG